MKRHLIRIIAIVLIVTTVIYVRPDLSVFNFNGSTKAYAVGALSVNWGVGVNEGDPIFTVSNFIPGNSESRSVAVMNGDTVSRTVGIRGIKTQETGNIGDVLLIQILDGVIPIYGEGSPTGNKTLTQFFAESSNPIGIQLSTLNSTQSTNYIIVVRFLDSAGNQYQDKSITFDLKIGITVDIPSECSEIEFNGKVLFGTEENDKLNGSSKNDLIFGFGGNDKISGGTGDDCIIGGDGNDKVNSGSGIDVVFGGSGNDDIDGGSDSDKLFGDQDDDKMDGGAGNDHIWGGNGNDNIKGGSGHDQLNGEADVDYADGDSGTDTCIAETKKKCEL